MYLCTLIVLAEITLVDAPGMYHVINLEIQMLNKHPSSCHDSGHMQTALGSFVEVSETQVSAFKQIIL